MGVVEVEAVAAGPLRGVTVLAAVAGPLFDRRAQQVGGGRAARPGQAALLGSGSPLVLAGQAARIVNGQLLRFSH